MQNFNLLHNLTKAFQQSSYMQSEQLFKKIVDLAADKLLKNQSQKQNLISKLNNKKIYSRLSIKRKSKKINKKSITKSKLKQSVIKKISLSNKNIHEQYLKAQNLQNKNVNNPQVKTERYHVHFQSEKQEEKQQSPQIKDLGSKILKLTDKRITISQVAENIKLKSLLTSFNDRVQEKFQKIHKNFQNYLKFKENQHDFDQISCPVCIETLIDPVSTVCGHSFCFSCLDESLLFSHTCPVCRLNIKGMDLIPCKNLSSLIRIKNESKKMTPQEKQVYQLRKVQNSQWRQKRFIKLQDLKVGLSIDVRDTEHIWCPATVMNVFHVGKQISSILVHYLHWAKLYDEVIEIKSIRLAPRGCFSTRTDLPRYNLHQENQNLRGTVINGNQNYQYEIIRPERNFPVSSQQLLDLQQAITTLRNNIAHRPQNFGQFRDQRLMHPQPLGLFGYEGQQSEDEYDQQINLMLSSSQSQQAENEEGEYNLLPYLGHNYQEDIDRASEQDQQQGEMQGNMRNLNHQPQQNDSGMIVLYRAGENLNFYNPEHDQGQEEQNSQDEDDEQNGYQNDYFYDCQ